jgi:hypothetical protein
MKLSTIKATHDFYSVHFGTRTLVISETVVFQFLIEKKANVSDACMWSDRFSIRHDMIPSIFERDVDVLGKVGGK